jgi:hypothetical protein
MASCCNYAGFWLTRGAFLFLAVPPGATGPVMRWIVSLLSSASCSLTWCCALCLRRSLLDPGTQGVCAGVRCLTLRASCNCVITVHRRKRVYSPHFELSEGLVHLWDSFGFASLTTGLGESAQLSVDEPFELLMSRGNEDRLPDDAAHDSDSCPSVEAEYSASPLQTECAAPLISEDTAELPIV